MRRAIQNLIEDRLSDEMLAGKFQPGDKVRAVAQDGRIVLEKEV